MDWLVDWIASLQIPYLTEPEARFLSHLIFASIIAVAAPGMLIILTWLERKIIGRIQNRIGPNRAGPFGLFQAIADMIKMFTKEDITPANADRVVYNIAPGLAVISSILVFAVIPFVPGFIGADLSVGILYVVAVGGFGTLAILMAGWSSNNKYALLGAFRVVAMLLTYEIPMVMALIIVTMVAGSMSMAQIVEAQSSMWYIFTMPLVFLIFFLAGVAETGRSPFDLIEAESEIIAGFHTEYSGIKFGMFMIGEYVHMLALAFLSAVLFLGGWQIPFIDITQFPGLVSAILGFLSISLKTFLFVFIMMWFRGTLPRFRIDHLQNIGWKFLVPLSLVLLVAVAFVVRLFAPGSSSAVPVVPGALSALGAPGEAVALLAANLLVLAGTVSFVSRMARRSKNRQLRAVAAVEPVPAK
ncbi:MAG: NADH-quinone oxidoreductase subunit NuoH [Chloroflexi bacterium]|nr:MAG: NADH-quinone oxidoreductase subunit NuoH [Chloroflexota bacterium]